MSNSLRPHGLQYARLPCPSPTPGAYSNAHPLSQWCHLTISSSVVPFSSCLQSFPASRSFQMRLLDWEKKQFQTGCKDGTVFQETAKLHLRKKGEGNILNNLGMAQNFICHVRIPGEKNGRRKHEVGGTKKYGNFYNNITNHRRRQWHPTPVLLPGKAHGQKSLVGCSPWGRWGSDTTEQLHFHALEKEMATHSSVLAWRIPGMGEPGGLPSMGSHRVGHDWSDLAANYVCRYNKTFGAVS